MNAISCASVHTAGADAKHDPIEARLDEEGVPLDPCRRRHTVKSRILRLRVFEGNAFLKISQQGCFSKM